MYRCDGRPSAAFKTETARAGRFCGTNGVDRESTQPRSTSMEARGPVWEQVRMVREGLPSVCLGKNWSSHHRTEQAAASQFVGPDGRVV